MSVKIYDLKFPIKYTLRDKNETQTDLSLVHKDFVEDEDGKNQRRNLLRKLKSDLLSKSIPYTELRDIFCIKKSDFERIFKEAEK